MSDFVHRTRTAQAFIDIFKKYFWDTPNIAHKFFHVNLGYENIVPQDVRELLRTLYSDKTACFIRFLPDFIVVRKEEPLVLMLEYKVCKTPRYSEGERQWYIAQIEAAPFENYLRLAENLELKVAICLFMPYSEKPIYIDWVNKFAYSLIRHHTRPEASLGSGTPYVNIDTRRLSTFVDFLRTELNIDIATLKECFSEQFWNELRTNNYLKVQHHPDSPYKNRTINWDIDSMFDISD